MKEYVRTILDYPVKGIQFRDITTLLQNAGHFKQVIDEMTEPWENEKIDAVLSIESRGFIMAGAIAYNIGAAFIPFRKPDKLPGETFKVSYSLEYGSTEMHVHKDALFSFKDFLTEVQIIPSSVISAYISRISSSFDHDEACRILHSFVNPNNTKNTEGAIKQTNT